MPCAASASTVRPSGVIKTAAETCKGRVPIVGGAGGGTTLAIKYAQEAERNGAQGVLLLPHYLTEASQEGLLGTVLSQPTLRRRTSSFQSELASGEKCASIGAGLSAADDFS